MIDQFFLWCVWVLEVIGEVTGMGYELANIVIFVILQPGLILLFFILYYQFQRHTYNALRTYHFYNHTLIMSC